MARCAGAAQCAGDGDGRRFRGRSRRTRFGRHCNERSGPHGREWPTVEAAADDADMNLIDFLHERQDLTGTKLCCGIGVLGVHGRRAQHARRADGKDARARRRSARWPACTCTRSGFAQDGTLSPLQQSFRIVRVPVRLLRVGIPDGRDRDARSSARAAGARRRAGRNDRNVGGRQRAPMHRLRQIHRGHPQRAMRYTKEAA